MVAAPSCLQPLHSQQSPGHEPSLIQLLPDPRPALLPRINTPIIGCHLFQSLFLVCWENEERSGSEVELVAAHLPTFCLFKLDLFLLEIKHFKLHKETKC